MGLTEEEKGYDIDALKESIKDCRQNKVTYNRIAFDPRSSKEDVITFKDRVNIENEKIRKYERIIAELEEVES